MKDDGYFWEGKPKVLLNELFKQYLSHFVFFLILLTFISACQSTFTQSSNPLGIRDELRPSADQKYQRTIKMTIWADLRARQQNVNLKLQKAIQAIKPILFDLGINLIEDQSFDWQTNGEDNLDSLFRKLKEKADKEGIPTDTIWLGYTATTPPSHATTDQLIQSRYAQPLILMRDVAHYFSGIQEDDPKDELKALKNLLLLAIGQIFGALPTCQLDWMTFSKNQLLGMKLSNFVYQRPITSSNRYRNQFDTVETISVEADQLNDQLSIARRIKKWAPINQTLIHLHRQIPLQINPHISSVLATSAIDVIRQQQQEQTCALHTPRLELLYAIRYQNQEALLEDEKLGIFENHPLLKDYQEIALGLKALNDQKPELAYQKCQPIASHKPSTLASKCAGLASVQLNDSENAIRFLRAYLGVNPKSEESILALAKQIGKNGDDLSALSLLMQALEINPSMPKTLLNIGIAYIRLQKYEKAKDYLNQINSTASEYQDAQQLIKQIESIIEPNH
jgi:tetratricopeptide (TPR) repeat protein